MPHYENGNYRAKPIKAELGVTGTGKEQVGIEFDLLDLPGNRIAYYGTFASDKAFEITMKALRTSGFKGDDVSDLSSIGGDDAPEVILVLENEEYQGKTHTKVKFVNSAGGLAMKNALSGDQAKAFAAQMRGRILAFNRSNPSAPAASQPKANGRAPADPDSEPSPFNDDLPF